MDPADQSETRLVEQLGHVEPLLQCQMRERCLIGGANEHLRRGEQRLGLGLPLLHI